MTTFVNLTPHVVVIYGQQDEILLDVPTSGAVARLVETAEPAGDLDGAPLTTVRLGDCASLPDPKGGTVYIASMPLLMGLAAAGIDRPDVVYPYGQVRDAAGRIIGCRSLARIAP